MKKLFFITTFYLGFYGTLEAREELFNKDSVVLDYLKQQRLLQDHPFFVFSMIDGKCSLIVVNDDENNRSYEFLIKFNDAGGKIPQIVYQNTWAFKFDDMLYYTLFYNQLYWSGKIDLRSDFYHKDSLSKVTYYGHNNARFAYYKNQNNLICSAELPLTISIHPLGDTYKFLLRRLLLLSFEYNYINGKTKLHKIKR